MQQNFCLAKAGCFDKQNAHCENFIYQSLGSVSTSTQRIIIYFQNMNSFFNFEILIIFIIYYNDMSSEIIQSVVYDNYDDFQHVKIDLLFIT